MSIKRVTFSLLRDHFVESVGQRDLTAQSSVANHISALGDFISDMGWDWSHEVGQLLRTQYESLRDAHGERLAARGKPRSYVKNRLSLLNKWFRYLQSLDYKGASITGDLNPFQQVMRPLLIGWGTLSRTAREIGVATRTLLSWSKDGRTPQAAHLPSVERLEQLRGLAPGSLLNHIPRRRKPPPATSDNPHAITHRKKLAKRLKFRYRLRPHQIPESHRLRVEIPAFVRYKVEGKSSNNIRRSRGKVLSRALRSTGEKSWRTRELRAHWKTEKSMAKRWPEILDGLWVPTANRSWNALLSFLGWAMIAEGEGGAGLDLETLTLGLLADQDHLFRYLDWYMEASGQTHGGHLYFFDTVLMLLHPKDGFLPKQATIGANLGYDAAAWLARCADTLNWIYLEILPMLKENYEKDGRARKPFEPIQHILNLDRPLDAMMRAINRAEEDRHTTGGEHEVSWARDLALMALMTSNPLRILNFIDLTYRSDNTGQLRQMGDGNWRIVITKGLFKNMRGAAKEHDYDQAVDPSMTPYITRYIRTYRPLIGGLRSELVFVSTDHPDQEFDKLDVVVRNWTEKYVENCQGIGPHAVRHIVATHIIKTTLGNFFLAATALHDNPITVKRSYAQFLPRYADRGRFESYSGSTQLLKGVASRSRVITASP
jgi:hypothetical protein